MGFMHRDYKLDNILLNSVDEGHLDIRVADFGLACEVPHGKKLFRNCGTPTYIAPEMLRVSLYD